MNQDQEFFETMRSLDEDLADSIMEALIRLNWSLKSNQWSVSIKLKSLKQLSTYLRKKADELDPVLIEMNERNLRKVRNDLAHGRSFKGKDFSSLYPALWKAIAKLGKLLEPKQLEDLLAYTMGLDNLGLFRNHPTSSQVIAVYKPLFNSLEADEKRRIFGDLLLRLFSDDESLALLDFSRSK